MNDTPPSQNRTRRKGSGILLSEDMIKTSIIHQNISQEVIVTTADKIELVLIEHESAIKIKGDWMSPFSILIAVIASLAAADFKTFAGINADTWRALFIITAIGSAAWLIITLTKIYKNRGKSDYKAVIDKLKKTE